MIKVQIVDGTGSPSCRVAESQQVMQVSAGVLLASGTLTLRVRWSKIGGESAAVEVEKLVIFGCGSVFFWVDIQPAVAGVAGGQDGIKNLVAGGSQGD